MKNKKYQTKDVSTIEVLTKQHEWSENNKKSGGMVSPPEKDYKENFPFTYERFKNMPEKVVYRKMEKLNAQGYLEYGVSLRTAWLTEKGLLTINDK